MFQFEPSMMVQLRESTGERIVDFNLKVYKDFNKTKFFPDSRINYSENILKKKNDEI